MAAFEVEGLRADRRRRPRRAAQPRRGRAAAAGAAALRSRGGDRARRRGGRGGAGGAERERSQARAARAGAGAAAARPGRRPASTSCGRCAPRSKAKAMAAYREAIEAAISRTAEAGEGGEAYRHLGRAAGALLGPLRGGEGAPRRDRLRGPADPRRAAARAGRDRRGLPRPLQPPAGRRVPGHQPPAAAADRGAARAAQRAGRGRRRAAIDLRLPPRRPRGLPPAAPPDRRSAPTPS